MATEADLAKSEAIKRFRAAVRLEMSIAGDWVIGRHLDSIKEQISREISSGGLPALERGVGSWAKQIADSLSPMIEREVTKLLEAGVAPDPQS
jgi:hypothetical protein